MIGSFLYPAMVKIEATVRHQGTLPFLHVWSDCLLYIELVQNIYIL